jgi:hypothetical protein
MKCASLVFSSLLPFVLLTAGCGGSATRTATNTAGTPGAATSETKESVRDALTRAGDAASIRTTLQQLTAAAAKPDAPFKPASLDEKQRGFLEDPKQVGLSPEELKEIDGNAFTPLDAHYLDECFLLRDVARSLDLDGLPVEDRATAAFAWVIRQVRLRELRWPAEQPMPVAYVLQGGWGTSLERSLVFIALLRQLGIEGCMVHFARAGNEGGVYDVCGVPTATGSDLYLYDSHLGLPLPGPNGRGIATLSTVCKQAHLLDAFPVDERYRFGVTPAKILLISELSALSGRMRSLQDELLGPEVKIKLALDLRPLQGEFAKIAVAQGGSAQLVEFSREAPGFLRRFLPTEEGGTDQVRIPLALLDGYLAPQDADPALSCKRREFFYLSLVPWRLFPASLRKLHYRSAVGQAPRGYFVQLCAAYVIAPRGPRAYVLRGRFTEAAAWLVDMREKQVREQRAELQQHPELPGKVEEWSKEADAAYVAVLTAEDKEKHGSAPPGQMERAKSGLEHVQKEGQKLYPALLEGVSADARGADVTYQLALCMHEQAAQRATQVRRAGAKADAAEKQAVRDAWTTAISWWNTYASDYPRDASTASARLLRAHAHREQDDTKTASSLLEDTSGRLSELEKAARLYEARQLKK